MPQNRCIVLKARPEGRPKESDFELVTNVVPAPGEGQFLVRTNYASVDPYMRGRMAGHKTYVDPIPVGGVVEGGSVGTVVESKHAKFQPGDVVLGNWGWQEYALLDGRGVERVDTSLAPMSTALGVLGMPGMTAYFGILEVGRIRPGDSVFVSGAAGAVGSLVGQIAKIGGCRVAGSAGSQAKVDYLVNELGFDAAFNYKEGGDYARKLKKLCPDGIDVYFDNVGGPISDAVYPNLNLHARVAVCGQIDQYNATEQPTGPRVLFHLIIKRARVEGFLVFNYQRQYPEARRRIAQWIREGKVKYEETITDGIENTPKAFIGLFTGENTGKQLVRFAPEEG